MSLRGLYAIPAGVPFARALAAGLLEETGTDGARLSETLVLLPTRRACRTLAASFLDITNGRPLLLPRMRPLGDVDEDDPDLAPAGGETAAMALSLPPALPPLRRRIMLARAVMKMPDYARSPDQAFALADALGTLMDQVYTEGLDLRRLPDLVSGRELAEHWQITVKFLEILSETWPRILEAHGVIDAADRRNRLLAALAESWESAPPPRPVVAAGSTGSIPATARLLTAIAHMREGCVVLPGLDQSADPQSWQALDDTHPQATLRHLLERMGKSRDDVRLWPAAPPPSRDASEPPAVTERKRAARARLAGEMMRPAATAEQWRTLHLNDEDRDSLERSLAQIRRCECENPEQEALLIALVMRETLERPGRTAALVTPDRTLARRVAAACRRWGIELDDSAGIPLADTPAGAWLRLVLDAALADFRPGALAALLRHRHCHMGRRKKDLGMLVDRLETGLLRGPVAGRGFAPFYAAAAQKENADAAESLLRELESLYTPMTEQHGETPFAARLAAHIALAESLAATPDETGPQTLWRGEDGEQAALFLASLREHADDLPPVSALHYREIFCRLMAATSVRPAWGTHPRLAILGLLEARLNQADITILAGLNEKTWPPDAGNDPWMSRPMRRDFCLPAPERAIGLSAHDFVQGFCSPNVVLTRSRRVDGTPSVPSRWLQRLDAVMQAFALDPGLLTDAGLLEWSRRIDRPDRPSPPARRPEPRPPVEMRPARLYVTAIEQWMRDPYSLYARHILRLRKLPDLEERADAAERGTLLHEALRRFVQQWPAALPAAPEDELLKIGRETLGDRLEDPRLWGFWWPRFERLAAWFAAHETAWRGSGARNAAVEAQGETVFTIADAPFTLCARADRIDLLPGGDCAVIDYKTGTAPAAKEAAAGYAPQLPLEALIIQEGGFPAVPPAPVAYMGFWKMTGGPVPGEEKTIAADIEQARKGLFHLIRTFHDPATPYYSLPRPHRAPPAAWQDYAHLARVQEWAALDEAEEAA